MSLPWYSPRSASSERFSVSRFLPIVAASSGNHGSRSCAMMSPMRIESDTLSQKYGAMAASGESASLPHATVDAGASASATPGASSDHGTAASMSTMRMFASRAKRYSGSPGNALVSETTAAADLNVGASVSARRSM